MSPTVGVLVTNYDSWNLALACIKANIALCGTRLDRIILLDDCSPTPAPMDAINASFELICNEENLGFARTLNKGIALLGTDIIILFDADARPLNDYLDSILYDFSCDPALAVVGFRAVDEANRTTPSYEKEPNIFSLLLGQKMYARCQNFLERKEDRLCVWMCAIAIRRTAFEELGRFDTDLEMLDLDLDFGMRVNRSQWKTKINQDLIVFHKGGGSPMLLSKRLLRLYKSRWILLRKHHKIRHPWLARK